jgi:hypothetical protein
LEKVHYDPSTGIFTRTPPNHRRKIGQFDKNGYVTIAIDRVKHQAQRLAWLYMTGSHPGEGMHIDHINRVKDDNRWENLREATPLQNSHNRPMGIRDGSSSSRSGIHGVYWDGRKQRWYVQMRCLGKTFYGSYHQTIENAQADAEIVRERLIAYSNTLNPA